MKPSYSLVFCVLTVVCFSFIYVFDMSILGKLEELKVSLKGLNVSLKVSEDPDVKYKHKFALVIPEGKKMIDFDVPKGYNCKSISAFKDKKEEWESITCVTDELSEYGF